MPRNGSGVFSLPPGSTIANGDVSDATDINTPLADIAADLNVARPVVAGGTGAASAADARTNLAVPGLATNSTVTGDWTVSGAWTLSGANTFSGATTFTADTTYNDSVEVFFGTDSDARIFHNGTSFYIEETGSGNMNIRGQDISLQNSNGTATYIYATSGGGVSAFFNNSLRTLTVDSGLRVIGQLSFPEQASATAPAAGFGSFWVKNDAPSSPFFTSDTGVDTKLAGTAIDETITGTWSFNNSVGLNGGATFQDNDKAIFGAGGDLEIYHNGATSIIADVGTGNLEIRGTELVLRTGDGAEVYAQFTANGSAALRHDNTTRLETTSGGIEINVGGLLLNERADHAHAPAAGKAEIWVKNDTPSSLWFTDDAGNDKQVAFAGDADITLRAEQATTSGTAFDFTSIPAGVNEITVMFDGISLSGTDEFLVQLGDSGGVETSGYDSVSGLGGATPQASTAGFIISGISASEAISGMMKLSRMSGNKWVSMHELHRGSGLSSIQGSGIKTLSAELTQLRLTRSGTDTFDAGAVAINYR